MWYADTVGVKKIYEKVCEFHNQLETLWDARSITEETG